MEFERRVHHSQGRHVVLFRTTGIIAADRGAFIPPW
jgi:hypothetical protein